MRTIDRGQFLRLGAVGAGAALLAPVASAGAALPSPAPQGDDVGFIQLGAVGERISLEVHRELSRSKLLTRDERRRARTGRDATAKGLAQLNRALGDDDAIEPDTFTIGLPPRELRARGTLVRLGERIEAVLVGLYLNGVQNAEDPATRLLLGRLLALDVQEFAWLRSLRGATDYLQVPGPLSVERAGDALDRFLAIPGVEPS